MDLGQIIFMILCSGVGCLMGYLGATSLLEMRRFVATAERAIGKVVDYKVEHSWSTDDDSGHRRREAFAYPIVEFQDAQGNVLRAATSTDASPPSFALQKVVNVLYHPDDPDKAEIDAFSALWLVPLLILGSGLLSISFAIALVVFNIPVRMGSE